MSEMGLIMEQWKGFLHEQEQSPDIAPEDRSAPPECLEFREPTEIVTIGQLQAYFQAKDPGTLKKLATRYGRITAKVVGIAVGAATGGVGAVASTIAAEVIQQMLQASIMAFADLEDGSYAEGTAGTYFDLDDHLSLFLRDLETQGVDITKPSKPEMEVFTIMKKHIEDAVRGGADPCTTIADLLKNITVQSLMDKRIATGEHSGKVKITPAGA